MLRLRFRQFINYDLHLTRHWVDNHISDYSGFQYRQWLISALRKNTLTECDDLTHLESVLTSEMDMLQSHTLLYPDRESLFSHRRFVLSKWHEWFPIQLKAVQETEMKFIESQLSHAYSNHCTWQLELINRHVRWIKTALKWDTVLRFDPVVMQNSCVTKVHESKLVPNVYRPVT